ncbi:MAG: hypothetical protein H7246_00145 [Phycisphaerae bacterium]|nr:hypothetical protein [Saprospiraceae bacterium]
MKSIRLLTFLFLLSLFLFSQTACVYYQRYSMSNSRLQKINPEGLSIYLVDAAHPLTRGWYLSEPRFEKNSVSGFISRMAEVEILEASMLRGRADAQQSKNDILLYAKPQFAIALPDTATLTIQNTNLEKVEVCELNHVRTIGMPLLGCTGGLLLVYLISGGIE